MDRADRLQIYLNDHLAGAVVLVEILEFLIAGEYPDELRSFAESLLVEVREDQEVLRNYLLEAGGSEHRLKQPAAWLFEKTSRLKLATGGATETPLNLLEQFDLILLGIRGKEALWDALAVSLGGQGPFDLIDLARLHRRADDQLRRVEAHRLEIARLAFS